MNNAAMDHALVSAMAAMGLRPDDEVTIRLLTEELASRGAVGSVNKSMVNQGFARLAAMGILGRAGPYERAPFVLQMDLSTAPEDAVELAEDAIKTAGFRDIGDDKKDELQTWRRRLSEPVSDRTAFEHRDAQFHRFALGFVGLENVRAMLLPFRLMPRVKTRFDVDLALSNAAHEALHQRSLSAIELADIETLRPLLPHYLFA